MYHTWKKSEEVTFSAATEIVAENVIANLEDAGIIKIAEDGEITPNKSYDPK